MKTVSHTKRECRVCGCSDNTACVEASGLPCCWIDWDLCSKCWHRIYASYQADPEIIVAFCWRSGLIEFGPFLPMGANEIACGPVTVIREIAVAWARHSRPSGDLLVPGVPEAEDEEQALVAFRIFKTGFQERMERRGLLLAAE